MMPWWGWVLIAGTLIGFAWEPAMNWLQDRFVHRDHGYGRSVLDYRAKCSAEGFSYAQTSDNVFLLEQLARLRREASDAVEARPWNWYEELSKAKDAAIARVALYNPDLLPAFGKMITAGTYADILYERAARLADEQMVGIVTPRPDEDMRNDMVASMRIRR